MGDCVIILILRCTLCTMVSHGSLYLHQELVQSALLESNTGRDDHILYNKLVRMSDI